MNTIQNDFIESIKKQFAYYKSLGDKTFAQLEDKELFWQYNENSNSIAIVVKHLVGNMLSRWTEFYTSDGEKRWRNRDNEFENNFKNKKEIIDKWEEGWRCLFSVIHTLQPEDLEKTITIRNEKHTVLEAINRQLAHYPYHVGQIVFVAKMLNNNNWQSLSIPKGNSETYNAEKFGEKE